MERYSENIKQAIRKFKQQGSNGFNNSRLSSFVHYRRNIASGFTKRFNWLREKLVQYSYRMKNFWHRNSKNILLTVLVLGILGIFLLQALALAEEKRKTKDIQTTLNNTVSILKRLENNSIDREEAVQELLGDNKKQTELIICLLAIHGENVAITELDEERCRVLVFEAQAEQQQNRETQRQPERQPIRTPEQPEPEQPQTPNVPDNPNIPESVIRRLEELFKRLTKI